MIAETGLAALWFAAAMALLQLALSVLALATRRRSVPFSDTLAQAVGPVALVQALLAAGSFAALVALFVRTDLSVLLVASNSHSAKPLLYRVAGTWGNHEGSMLLWVMVLAVAGGGIALIERRLDTASRVATLGAQGAIALGFYAFLLAASNPFARLWPPPVEGLGLNPLLQDPGLAFHPPTLYLGYVGLSVAFSFAIGALVTGSVGRTMAVAMRPWVLGAWVFLTIGITAGSYWAYYELGWGGWWFWDPVENASLMPWLAATALLHSVTVLAARDALRAWTIMLGVVAFSMAMVGTFLVRSGIVTSVHAFAVDPARGGFLLVLLLLYVGGALALFALRIGTVRQGALFDPISREAGLVLNNLLLSVLLGIVLIGTLYPLAAQAWDVQLSVGPPFFNRAAGPIALFLMVAMAVGPLVRWRRDDVGAVARRVALPAAVAVLVAIAVAFTGDAVGVLPLAGLALGVGTCVASVLPLAGRSPWRTPLFTWGMVVAHLGIGVSVIGMACDAAFTRERLVAAAPGETHEVGPFAVTLLGASSVVGPNWSAVEGRLRIERGGEVAVLRPQQRFFADPPTETNEAAIRTYADGQLYAVFGKGEGGRRQLRLWWKPFVTLIWLGGGLVALGGLLSLAGRVRRGRRVRRSELAA